MQMFSLTKAAIHKAYSPKNLDKQNAKDTN